MENRGAVHSILCATCLAFGLTLTAPVAAATESDTLLTGKAAMGDWTSDAPRGAAQNHSCGFARAQ